MKEGKSMRSSKLIKWIEAGKAFAGDNANNVDILCPECNEQKLEYKDSEHDPKDKNFERIIYCPSCGARYTITIIRYAR